MTFTDEEYWDVGGNMTREEMIKYRSDCDAALPMHCIKDGVQFILYSDGKKEVIKRNDPRYTRYQKVSS